MKEVTTADPWEELKAFTDARIALGRCGVAPPLQATLDFRLAHAKARDAVHQPFQGQEIKESLNALHPTVLLRSAAADRYEFLTRPDKGRTLSDESERFLRSAGQTGRGCDVCLLLGDGLSARAIHENGPPFVARFLEAIQTTNLSVGPICVVENARVALSDVVGSLIGAKLVCLLIGERPGLSSPNSMGVYLTYAPALGKTDDSRNCISNIRKGGLSVEAGVQKTSYLIEQAFALKLSGVDLKDEMPDRYLPFVNTPRLKS